MKQELVNKLVKDFPSFFRDLGGDPMKTCMAWGIEHGDGWFKLFYELNEKIANYLKLFKKKDRPDFYWSQIKEKFGTARWYYGEGDDIISDLVSYNEDKTAQTCETCGEWGKVRGKGWHYTACNEHAQPEDKDND